MLNEAIVIIGLALGILLIAYALVVLLPAYGIIKGGLRLLAKEDKEDLTTIVAHFDEKLGFTMADGGEKKEE